MPRPRPRPAVAAAAVLALSAALAVAAAPAAASGAEDELQPQALCGSEEGCGADAAIHMLQVRAASQRSAAVGGTSEKGAYRRFYGGGAKAKESKWDKCSFAQSSCSLGDMKAPTLVYPGGLKCMSGDDYAFAVHPGAADKLLFLFEGGGACWEATNPQGQMVIEQCTENFAEALENSGHGEGVQADDERNPLRGYTMVTLLYCSGDAFLGNSTMMNSEGRELTQQGYAHAAAAVAWARRNLQAELDSLVVGGWSAGCLGTMAWSRSLLQQFSYKRAAVILDSYAGYFPEGIQGKTLLRWGACDLPLWDADMQAKCRDGQLTVQEALARSMGKYANVAFGSIQSKVDGAQVWFYQGIAKSWGRMADASLTETQFYAGTNSIFEAWSSEYPNYVLYSVDGAHHCYLPSHAFYTATTAGADDGTGSPEGQLPLHRWVQELIRAKAVPSECSGLLLDNGAHGFHYCDRALLPKVLVLSE